MKQFIIKSSPQIIDILESVLELTSCRDKSLLFHRLLLLHIKDVVDSDLVVSSGTMDGSLYKKVEVIFENHLNEYV